MSRLTQVRDAVRPAMKARLLLAGPPGSGKTRTGLVVATELADGGDILVIDTEEESATTYADDFTFKHLPWEAPYDPRDLTDTVIEAGNNYAVIVIDSMTHFWRGEGGTLDIAGGKFTGWKAARPAQRGLVEAILRSPAHMVLCARSKVEHTQTEDKKVIKLGMAVQQDDELEYEINVSVDIDMDHRLSVSKTRCKVLADRMFQPGERNAAEFARTYSDWLKGGEPVADADAVRDLKAEMDALQPDDYRKACKGAFVEAFGKPDYLRASHLDAAKAKVATFIENQPKDEPAPEPAGENRIDKLRGHFFALCAQAGIDTKGDDGRKRYHALLKHATGGAYESTTQLTREDMDTKVKPVLTDVMEGRLELHLRATGEYEVRPVRLRSVKEKAGA